MRRSLWALGGGIALALALTLAACAPAPDASLPQWLRTAPYEVRDAYAYAVAHPEVLEYMPCYCGCNGGGHRSNRDCYIQEIRRDGTVKYDFHATG
ncbi:MAG: hypothetical protein HY684_02750 [Chloroflexi bacterium]|nr:hypothetical protein [Chloroflexota bacterium]